MIAEAAPKTAIHAWGCRQSALMCYRESMKSLFTLTVAVAFCASPAHTAKSEYTSKEDNFSITVNAQVKKTTLNHAGVAQRAYQVIEGQDRYGITVATYGRKIEVSAKQQRAYFDEIRDRALKKLRGKVIFERDVRLGDHLGREYTIRTTNLQKLEGREVRFTQRIFAIGHRLYTLYTVSRAHGLRHERYLSSFRLLEDKGAPDALRFSFQSVRHADEVGYRARLPESHRVDKVVRATRIIDWPKVAQGLMYERQTQVHGQSTTYTVGTFALTENLKTLKEAEALLDAARLEMARTTGLDAPKFSIELSLYRREIAAGGGD